MPLLPHDAPLPSRPRRVLVGGVTARTLRRWVLREKLWNGNREPGPWTSLAHPEGVVRWAWRTHHLVAGRVDALLEQDPAKPAVRLRSHREAAAWVEWPLADQART